MGAATTVIYKVTTHEYKKIIIDTTDGFRYYSDLSSFENVYCFPKDKFAWDQVRSDGYGLSLIWTSRFEVHIDQVIGLAYKKESIAESA